MLSQEDLECDICSENFTDDRHRPLILPCGHTICKSCCENLERKLPIRCPHDRRTFPGKRTGDFPTNVKLRSNSIIIPKEVVVTNKIQFVQEIKSIEKNKRRISMEWEIKAENIKRELRNIYMEHQLERKIVERKNYKGLSDDFLVAFILAGILTPIGIIEEIEWIGGVGLAIEIITIFAYLKHLSLNIISGYAILGALIIFWAYFGWESLIFISAFPAFTISLIALYYLLQIEHTYFECAKCHWTSQDKGVIECIRVTQQSAELRIKKDEIDTQIHKLKGI